MRGFTHEGKVGTRMGERRRTRLACVTAWRREGEMVSDEIMPLGMMHDV